MRLFAAFWLAAALLVASTATAQGVIDMGAMPEQEAKSHFKVGKSLYESGRFAEAAVEWNKAYELSHRIELLYNVYVAYRDASDIPHAIDALRRYLQGAEIDDATRVNLQARLRAMEESSKSGGAAAVTPSEPAQPAEPAPQPSAEPAPASAPVEPAPEPTPAPVAASTDDGGGSIVPYVLIGVGGALVIGGAVTGIVVLGNEKDLEDGCPDDRCTGKNADKLDTTKTLAVVTDVLWITGVVAAGVGTALLLLDDGGQEHATTSTTPRASVGCGPGGCGATVSGRF